MKSLKAILKEKKAMYKLVPKDERDPYPTLFMVVTGISKVFINFAILNACSYGGNNREHISVQFVTEATVKWDECSHFYFYGEDAFVNGEDDSYYHICGIESYVDMIDMYLMVIKVAQMYFCKGEYHEWNLSDYLERMMDVFDSETDIVEVKDGELTLYEFVN